MPLLVFPTVITARAVQVAVSFQVDESRVDLQFRDGLSDTRNLYYAAAKIKPDLLNGKGIANFSNLNEESAHACVPDSLYTLVRFILEDDNNDVKTDMRLNYSVLNKNVMNVCQDVVYAKSEGKKLTPKHVGIGLSIHHATRIKWLVNLLHLAGCSISYNIKTTIAESAISTFQKHGVVIPKNLVPGMFLQFSSDNIDILGDTVDGRNTFHATQIVAFQRGPKTTSSENIIIFDATSKNTTLKHVPTDINRILSAARIRNKTLKPKFHG